VVRVKRRPGPFHGYWFSLDDKKLRRASRDDIAEAYRLWAKHATSANALQIRHGLRISGATQVA
jgi:hypothetical protein